MDYSKIVLIPFFNINIIIHKKKNDFRVEGVITIPFISDFKPLFY